MGRAAHPRSGALKHFARPRSAYGGSRAAGFTLRFDCSGGALRDLRLIAMTPSGSKTVGDTKDFWKKSRWHELLKCSIELHLTSNRYAMIRSAFTFAACLFAFSGAFFTTAQAADNEADNESSAKTFSWDALAVLPNELGVAGPFAGVHNDALIVAGGANFPKPIWISDKAWYDDIYVLQKDGDDYQWLDGGKLPKQIGYGGAVSTKDGVLCIGGNHGDETYDDVFLLSWNRGLSKLTTTVFPKLPRPCAFTAATIVGDTVYVAGGQSGGSLSTAMNNFWGLDLSRRGSDDFRWQILPPIPGPTRALNLTVAQNNGEDDCVYVISGRHQTGEATEFLTDVWEFNTNSKTWQHRADAPQCMMAGTVIGVDDHRLVVLGGADGSNFHHGASLRVKHPGFPKKAFAFDTRANAWTDAGAIPANHVTTVAVKWGSQIVIPSGEVKPKVRSPKIWSLTPDR